MSKFIDPFFVEPPGETVIVPPKDTTGHEPATIIFLHGLGSCGKDQMVFAKKFQARFPYAKIVLPSSGKGPVTLNMGLEIPCWHDVHVLGALEPPKEGWRGIVYSRRHVDDVLAQELATGVNPARVIIGGFSQGGAMALLTAYTTKHKIGGIFACSGYSPYPDRNEARSTIASSINVHTPVFMGHGTHDQVVRFEAGRGTGDVMVAAGTPLQFKTYEKMGHTVNVKEMEDLLNFIESVLNPSPRDNDTGSEASHTNVLTNPTESKQGNECLNSTDSKFATTPLGPVSACKYSNASVSSLTSEESSKALARSLEPGNVDTKTSTTLTTKPASNVSQLESTADTVPGMSNRGHGAATGSLPE